jgi:hypothetical protein
MAPSLRFKLICLVLTASALCSCSRLKLAYSYADWLLLRQARQYMELNPDAEAALSGEIEAYHAWHRKEMLPAYAALCRKLARGFRGQERDEANVEEATPMLSTVWLDTVEPMITPVAGALESMDAKGIARLEEAYAKDSEKQRKLYLDDPAAAERRRVQKTLAYVEDFSGPLSPAQKEAIGALASGIPMPYAFWVADRERRKRELVALLKAHEGKAAIEAALRDWWLKSRISQGAPAEGQMDVREVKRFFLGTLRALTPAQREAAALKMEAYAAQFDELSRDSKGNRPK